jgi:hypothetical protein
MTTLSMVKELQPLACLLGAGVARLMPQAFPRQLMARPKISRDFLEVLVFEMKLTKYSDGQQV